MPDFASFQHCRAAHSQLPVFPRSTQPRLPETVRISSPAVSNGVAQAATRLQAYRTQRRWADRKDIKKPRPRINMSPSTSRASSIPSTISLRSRTRREEKEWALLSTRSRRRCFRDRRRPRSPWPPSTSISLCSKSRHRSNTKPWGPASPRSAATSPRTEPST